MKPLEDIKVAQNKLNSGKQILSSSVKSRLWNPLFNFNLSQLNLSQYPDCETLYFVLINHRMYYPNIQAVKPFILSVY